MHGHHVPNSLPVTCASSAAKYNECVQPYTAADSCSASKHKLPVTCTSSAANYSGFTQCFTAADADEHSLSVTCAKQCSITRSSQVGYSSAVTGA
jgi:hypothetical protein